MLTQLLDTASTPGLLVPLIGAAALIAALSAGIAIVVQSIRNIRSRSRSAGQLRDLLEVASEGILVHNAGEIVEANAPFCQLVGLQRDEVIGRSVLQYGKSWGRRGNRAPYRSGWSRWMDGSFRSPLPFVPCATGRAARMPWRCGI